MWLVVAWYWCNVKGGTINYYKRFYYKKIFKISSRWPLQFSSEQFLNVRCCHFAVLIFLRKKVVILNYLRLESEKLPFRSVLNHEATGGLVLVQRTRIKPTQYNYYIYTTNLLT